MAAIVNNKPDLVFSFSGGLLQVRDVLEEYDDLDISNFMCLDYIMYNDETVVNANIIEDIHTLADIEFSEFNLERDGLHAYYRILVPRLKKYMLLGKVPANRMFYYDHQFYYSAEDVYLTPYMDLNDDFDKVPIEKVYDSLENGFGIEDINEVMYNKYIIFSYEWLKKAFVDSEKTFHNKKSIKDLVGFKSGKTNRSLRDFLLEAMYAVKEYVRKDMFEEAHVLVTALTDMSCLHIGEVNLNYADRNKACACLVKRDYFRIEYLNPITTDDLSLQVGWHFGKSFPIILS